MRRAGAVRWVLYALALVVLVLHQDVWNWNRAEPLVMGFLPVGLAYHAGYTIVCSAVMFLFVKCLWPSELEGAERESSADHGRGH